MTVRMVKRNSLDGEYMILGRQTVEVNTVVQPFGKDQASSIAIQGTGLQENEFQDGFRMSTRSTQPMLMNVDVVDGIDSSMLAGLQGQDSVSMYFLPETTLYPVLTYPCRRLPLLRCYESCSRHTRSQPASDCHSDAQYANPCLKICQS
jgi:hypothetical protein